mmetsp:Transcript_41022/g.93579  ORF Transcript_41022/g.93579 Transcript_41022/m.93579 type:complete len:213 (+) Transcript_41022:2-640(+)
MGYPLRFCLQKHIMIISHMLALHGSVQPYHAAEVVPLLHRHLPRVPGQLREQRPDGAFAGWAFGVVRGLEEDGLLHHGPGGVAHVRPEHAGLPPGPGRRATHQPGRGASPRLGLAPRACVAEGAGHRLGWAGGCAAGPGGLERCERLLHGRRSLDDGLDNLAQPTALPIKIPRDKSHGALGTPAQIGHAAGGGFSNWRLGLCLGGGQQLFHR